MRLVAALVWAGRRLRPGLTCQKIRLQRQLLCIRKMTLTRGLFSNRAEQLVHYSSFKGSQQTSFSLFVCAQPKTSTRAGKRHVLWESQNVAQYGSQTHRSRGVPEPGLWLKLMALCHGRASFYSFRPFYCFPLQINFRMHLTSTKQLRQCQT